MRERLQKIISSRGVCSRRKAELYVQRGDVKVNGITAVLGQCADPIVDNITLFGKPLPKEYDCVTIMLNKPKGFVTTLSDERGRPTVLDLIPDIPIRLYPVGRLDMQSEGLLLMTNDGDLSNKISHPSHEVWKTYQVKIDYGKNSYINNPDRLLSQPINLDGVSLLPARCKVLTFFQNGCLMSISIREGKNRQIRRMCSSLGLHVLSLKRVSIGDLSLGNLESGKYRYLNSKEMQYLNGL